jgi:hypothetical protein
VLVDVVHIQLGDLADDLLQRCRLVVDEAVDEAVAGGGSRGIPVGEIHQPRVADGRRGIKAGRHTPAQTSMQSLPAPLLCGGVGSGTRERSWGKQGREGA